MEQQNNGNTVTVWVDGEELQRMESNDLAIYHTPGDSRVYLASGPQWRYDYCIATTQDLLDAMGYDFSDGLTSDDVAELTVELR